MGCAMEVLMHTAGVCSAPLPMVVLSSHDQMHLCGSAFPRCGHPISPTRYLQKENQSRCRRTVIARDAAVANSVFLRSVVEGHDKVTGIRGGEGSRWPPVFSGKRKTASPLASRRTWGQLSQGHRSRSRGVALAKAAKDERQEIDADAGLSSGVQGDVHKSSEKAGRGGQSGSLLSFLCPLLKLVGGGDPAQSRNTFLEALTSGVASIARLPWGSTVQPDIAAERIAKGQPQRLLQLYEFEACPFCRRVREALTELDLSAEVYPCPKGSLRHREYVRKHGGKEQFPYFVDPNTGVTMYESSEIVHYLFKEYGKGRKASLGLLESTLVTGWVPTLLRAGRGMMLYPKASSTPPPNKLELFSYENNQFARLVREALCELELPYVLRNAGKGSSYRDTLLQLTGSTRLPYLIDSNTGTAMPESLNIVTYLFQTYGAT